jgi:hypothetical protein
MILFHLLLEIRVEHEDLLHIVFDEPVDGIIDSGIVSQLHEGLFYSSRYAGIIVIVVKRLADEDAVSYSFAGIFLLVHDLLIEILINIKEIRT